MTWTVLCSVPMACGSFRAAQTVPIRVWPAVAGPKDLCDKLTANMSHKQWNEWVSPDIDYIKVCPDLPMPPD